MKGRKPLPTHLKLLEGNPGKRAINRREPKPQGDLFEPPGDLPAAALPFWTQAIAAAPAGLLKHIDLRVLAVWSIAAWLHSDAARQVATSATVVLTKSGEMMQHPSLSILNKQAAIMLKAAAEMGFTPSSRTRVALDGGEGSTNPFDDF
ncbi:MAG TPA: P27 family phage terminase small subunit [Reyranella sp.]|nr:P27 family phage terminase small subunit [Reyranella sp.]